MKKLRNLMLVFLILVGILMISIGLSFNYYTGAVGGSKEMQTITIENGSSNNKIGEVLQKNELIKSAGFFKLYLKLYKINNLKAGTYELNKEMTLREIIDILAEGPHKSDEEISILFKEGINMRQVAKLIATNTNNTEEDVFNKLKDEEYLKKLISEYWFITDDILDSKIYYSLEGYLFPDTYRFNSKDVKVEEIFAKLLKKMDTVLTPLKAEIEKSEFSVHELLTLASMVEKEENKADYRSKVASVFYNRLKKNMSLGSDVTTRYAIKNDDAQRALTKSEYNYASPYNTRLTDGSMNGKLPIGPICMMSESSIKATVNHEETDYIYFIANIDSNETFFFNNSTGFERKKAELASVNKGL